MVYSVTRFFPRVLPLFFPFVLLNVSHKEGIKPMQFVRFSSAAQWVEPLRKLRGSHRAFVNMVTPW